MDASTDFSRPALAGLVSAALVVVAAFLPWMSPEAAGGPVDVDASTTGIETLGLLTLLLAIVAVGIVFRRGFEDKAALSVGGVGALVAMVGLWKISDLGGAVSPELGLYLTVLGGVGLLATGLWGYQSTDSSEGAS